VAYLFLFVLDGEDLEVAEPSPTITATPSVSPSPTKTPRPTSPPVELIGDRDPFSIPPGLAPSPTGGEVSPTTTAPTTPPTTAPTTPPTTAPTTPPFTTPPFTTPPPTPPTTPTITPPPEGPTDQIVIGGHDVRLLDIFRNGKRVQVEVDGSVWTVEEGATFDDNFKLVKIQDGKCARFLFGDQSFELCTTAKK
jgi:hypothetical protein